MSMKTIRMSNGRPVSIDLENWTTWATATDYDHTCGDDFQNYSLATKQKKLIII